MLGPAHSGFRGAASWYDSSSFVCLSVCLSLTVANNPRCRAVALPPPPPPPQVTTIVYTLRPAAIAAPTAAVRFQRPPRCRSDLVRFLPSRYLRFRCRARRQRTSVTNSRARATVTRPCLPTAAGKVHSPAPFCAPPAPSRRTVSACARAAAPLEATPRRDELDVGPARINF